MYLGRVEVIGGGPAGLYFGLLMKKENPAHQVAVVERNRAYDTFGWGVVFSDATMENMRAWDIETANSIESAFNHWDDIEVLIKGRRMRTTGHGFVGIGRKKLLNILQARCEELGVELVFERDVDSDLEFPDADLIIASDGINSKIRNRYQAAFKPDMVMRPNRFVWLGSSKLYDAFTFDFRRTEHGWFQAHIYRFDDTTSTFIVETTEDIFKAHGLDQADEMGTGIDALGGQRRGRLSERGARKQRCGEFITAVWQNAHADIGMRPCDHRVLGAPIFGRARFARPLMRGPDRRGGVGETQQPCRGMKDEAQLAEPLRIDRGQICEAERRRLGGVIGLDPRVLQSSDVRQVRNLARGIERLDEGGKVGAVMDQHRRARLIASDERAREAAKELVADQTAGDGIAHLQRADQPDRYIVAINGETARIGSPLTASRLRGRAHRGIGQRRGR